MLTIFQMIDTVYWEEKDRDHLHEKILLGGILKRLDNDQPKQRNL